MYQLVCIIGESGSGKDKIFQEVLAECKAKNIDINKVINCTTRPMREGEKEGVNYYYLTGEEFANKILDGEMIEATCFNDWFYGTTSGALKEDKINIGIFNPDSIYNMSATPGIQLWVYYINVSEKTRLIRQLNREQNPDVREIIRRFNADLQDFDDLQFYHNVLDNENYDDLTNSVNIIVDDIALMSTKLQEALDENN